eukprot:scaffold25329_cov114-Isochrysis_galbana.AAC.3
MSTLHPNPRCIDNPRRGRRPTTRGFLTPMRTPECRKKPHDLTGGARGYESRRAPRWRGARPGPRHDEHLRHSASAAGGPARAAAPKGRRSGRTLSAVGAPARPGPARPSHRADRAAPAAAEGGAPTAERWGGPVGWGDAS